MNMRNISAWSIRNPVIPIILFAGLLIAGLVAFNRMTVINFPEVDFPAVTINVAQPGAAPTEVETQITQKIEGAVRSINGVEEISSTASEGSSSTFVFFTVGTNSNDATAEVKNAVDQIRGDLPDGILEPQVRKVEINGGSLLGYFAVSADDMTMEQLSWFIDDTVSRQLLSVEGMAKVSRGGGVDRQIRVVVDPARMQALGVTARDINNVLRQTNINAAGGQTEIAGSRQSVRVLGNAQTAYALGQSQINLGGGRTVKLSDVADVTDSYSERTSYSKLNGREVVTFSIERARGTSDVEVYDDAVRVLKKIEADNSGVHFTSLFTPVDYTKSQYESSMAAMIEGAILAIVVVFFFLRDWRATIISAIAIPLSAIPTFWFMDLLGFNLNTLSLLALGLVAGVLVDDAIVEIENIVRHMRMGKSAYQASIDAADEIGLAVVATTMSIVAVFLPVGMMPGIPGEFFKPFGLTVVVAVLCSLAVARMITPMIAAYFLRAHGEQSHGEGRAMDFYMRVLTWTLDSRRSHELRAKLAFVRTRLAYYVPALVAGVALMAYSIFTRANAPVDPLSEPPGTMSLLMGGLFGGFLPGFLLGWLVTFIVGLIYGRMAGYDSNGWTERSRFAGKRFLARARDHRFYAFLIGVGAFIATILMFMALPSQFQPEENNDTSQVSITMVPGTTLEQTERVARTASNLLQRQPETVRVLESVREGSATLYVALKPAAERETKTKEFEKRLTPELQTIADAQINFQGGDGGGGGSGRALSVMLSGSDPALLQSTAQTLVEQMRGVEGVVAPRIAADLQRPELIIRPRMDLAASLGVTTASLSQAIRIATLGEIDQNSAKFSLSDRQIPIRVILPKDSRQDLSTVENLPVPTASGGSVPLSRVAEISFGSGPTQIQRYNQSRRVVVGADIGPKAVSGDLMKQIRALPIMQNLPQGVSSEPVGDDKRQAEVINSFLVAVVSGVFLVFAVLVLLYRRFISPLVNMTSLLLAPLGGLIALWLFGMVMDGAPVPISMPVYIGILMLLGIVAKNSILLIDFAIEEMENGVPKKDAIIDAGHKRAQPIVMTTVAMVAGMVPTAISLSGDGAWRAPMGMVVIGGLILSTVLTLLLIPAGFSLADGFEKRAGPWLRTRLLTYKPGDDDGTIRGRPPEAPGVPAE
ncbi:efflux RND transporter permease subunit [Tsuneonella amylolytica]|uniref:efflux RND transporter permease subunit n=1 Tax=Tsuneonella amylolytica TaxID=2338327 RepID=UPI000EAA5CD1|nr:efflux RND transporter permease subunit [Tsuneonella amylolytica]